MSFFPTDPKKIKTRIRSYERALKKENARDGYGKRFLVGPLYLLLNDHKDALQYYDWYQKEFSGDGTEPLNHVAWALALLRAGNKEEAKRKLIQAAITNMHIWDWFYDGEMKKWEMWYGSNLAEPQYLIDAPEEYLDMWELDEIMWVEQFAMSDEVKSVMDTLFPIRKKLKNLAPGSERSELVTKLFQIESDYSDRFEVNDSNIVPFPKRPDQEKT